MTNIQSVQQKNAIEKPVETNQPMEKRETRSDKKDRFVESKAERDRKLNEKYEQFCNLYEKGKEERRKLIKKLERYANEPKKVVPSRFDHIEANINVLMFGFETLRKQSEESSVRSTETSKQFDTFKEQLTETVNGCVNRINTAEEKYAAIQKTLNEKEREMAEVKMQLLDQECQIKLLKALIDDQRKMMDLLIQFDMKPVNDQPF
jgi:chromosome segregation ATPase